MSEGQLRILVVDDEPAIRRFLRTSLVAHQYDVQAVANGEDALEAVRVFRPDLVVLDLGLPGLGGIDVTRLLREWTAVPILILSVRESETDKVGALDAGADDYLTKPFSMGELLARLRVLLRRNRPGPEQPIFHLGDLIVDLSYRRVTTAGKEAQLTPTEYELLRNLVVNAGRVLTHQQLLRQIWGIGYQADAHLLRVTISNLRHKIEPDPARPRYIITEPGVGYRLRASE
jgi:two-component system KDP operon response regulator KdpE